MFVFRKTSRALFPCNTRFEICPFNSFPTKWSALYFMLITPFMIIKLTTLAIE